MPCGAARRDAGARAEEQRRRRRRRHILGLVATVVVLGTVAAGLALLLVAARTRATVAFFGSSGDAAADDNIVAGLDRAARELDVTFDDVAPVVDGRREFRELAESGPDLIISTAADLWRDVVADEPEVLFGVIDGSLTGPNVVNVTFASEQGSFLVGAAAAMRSATGTVGFVGGERNPAIERFRAGFEAGAQHVDPGVEVLATYIEEPFAGSVGYFLSPFDRPDLGQARAEALYDRGADVVFHAASASGFGVLDAAVERSDAQDRQLWAIGVDNDQWLQATPSQRRRQLTSMIKRMDLAGYELTRQLVDGELVAGSQELDLADGVMDISTRGDGLTGAMVQRIERLKADIVAGAIPLPTTPRGELLRVDALPEGFDERFSGLTPQQIIEYYDDFLVPTYPRATDAACYEGTMRSCGQLMLDHVDEWQAAGTPTDGAGG